MKRLEDMNLMDDFLFLTMLSDENYGPKIAAYILETIFRRPVGKVTVHTQKVFYGRDPDLHGIRMDAYIEEDTETGSVKGDVYKYGSVLLYKNRTR